jgi:hypothetical protein
VGQDCRHYAYGLTASTGLWSTGVTGYNGCWKFVKWGCGVASYTSRCNAEALCTVTYPSGAMSTNSGTWSSSFPDSKSIYPGTCKATGSVCAKTNDCCTVYRSAGELDSSTVTYLQAIGTTGASCWAATDGNSRCQMKGR